LNYIGKLGISPCEMLYSPVCAIKATTGIIMTPNPPPEFPKRRENNLDLENNV
jgi:hypothetical protein